MGSGIFFPISAIPFSILLILLFFKKGYISNYETRIYRTLIILNFIGLLLELLCTVGSMIYFQYTFLSKLIYKSYLVYLLSWTATFTYYVYKISANAKIIKSIYIKKLIIFLSILTVIMVYLLPIELVTQNNMQIRYTIGASVSFSYIISAILILIIITILFKNFKKILNKKYLPVIALLIVGTISIVIQVLFPQMLLLTYVETLICCIMYFTIENPDVKMIEQLELARNQADKANKAKTEFLSSMSHEIRTPLNAIVGFSECLVENKNLEDEVKGYAKDIVDASNNLLEIVNGILDISKIEANKMEIIPKDYNPKEIFSSLEKLILPRIADKPIEFKTYIADDLPGVLNGDVSKLKQIIINILTNAAKYTDKGQIIYSISCINKIEKKKCSLFISVKDTGRGIKKESINKLFNKFERIDEDKNTTIEGTGLGLAITKRLVEMMGGKINVFSKYGEGSNFTVYIEQDIIDMNPPKEEKIETQINYNIYNGKKVLIVDDSTINLKVATQILKPYNFEITTAISGFEAIEKVNNQNFDLILMDIMMPKMNGVETLKKLKEKETFMIPVIALTADAIEGMDAKYISEGFSDYLSKPINKEELNRVINKYIIGGK